MRPDETSAGSWNKTVNNQDKDSPKHKNAINMIVVTMLKLRVQAPLNCRSRPFFLRAETLHSDNFAESRTARKEKKAKMRTNRRFPIDLLN